MLKLKLLNSFATTTFIFINDLFEDYWWHLSFICKYLYTYHKCHLEQWFTFALSMIQTAWRVYTQFLKSHDSDMALCSNFHQRWQLRNDDNGWHQKFGHVYFSEQKLLFFTSDEVSKNKKRYSHSTSLVKETH